MIVLKKGFCEISFVTLLVTSGKTRTKTGVLEVNGRFSNCFHGPAFMPIKEKMKDHKEQNTKPNQQKKPPSHDIFRSL